MFTDSMLGELFNGFIEHLKAHADRIAYAQLAGRIEEYLVREFCYSVHLSRHGRRLFAAHSPGHIRGQPQVDIAILNGRLEENEGDLCIVHMLEAKYFTNAAILGMGDDPNWYTLRGLGEQVTRLAGFMGKTIGNYHVAEQMPSRRALVLIGHTWPNGRTLRPKTRKQGEFYQQAEQKLKEYQFDGSLEDVYTHTTCDPQPCGFTAGFQVTLKAGLFKLTQAAGLG